MNYKKKANLTVSKEKEDICPLEGQKEKEGSKKEIQVPNATHFGDEVERHMGPMVSKELSPSVPR